MGPSRYLSPIHSTTSCDRRWICEISLRLCCPENSRGQGGCVTSEESHLPMSKPPPNHGKPWTSSDLKQLKALAGQNTPTRVIGLKTGRTPGAIYNAASAAGIPLKPTNQRPFNRQK